MVERIAIFAALPWEERTARRSVAGVKRVHAAAWPAFAGQASTREVWLVRTGIGEKRAQEAAEAIANAHRFDAFLSTGCAAGLVPELAPGHVVVADAVYGSDGEQRFGGDVELRRQIEGAASLAGVPLSTGSYTCGALLATKEDKRRAAARGAVVAEMEGAAIARVALRARIPFGAVRAVLDPFDVELRNTVGLVDPATGRVRPKELLHKIARPRTWSELRAMQRMMRAARISLERVFEVFLLEHAVKLASEEAKVSQGV